MPFRYLFHPKLLQIFNVLIYFKYYISLVNIADKTVIGPLKKRRSHHTLFSLICLHSPFHLFRSDYMHKLYVNETRMSEIFNHPNTQCKTETNNT